MQAYRMVDVGEKAVTHRVATAVGTLQMNAAAFQQLKTKTLPKGDPLPMAETAGIMATKKTHECLPLCHPLSLESVKFSFLLDDNKHALTAQCQVSAHEKTGVEMEALMGVQAALLTVYDLIKPVDPALTITNVLLQEKIGGKKGHWTHPSFTADEKPTDADFNLDGVSVAVLTISDRASAGTYEDVSGKVMRETLSAWGADIVEIALVADEAEEIKAKLLEFTDAKSIPLVLSTGGTGISHRDVTPEVVATIADRHVPGIGECLRASGAKYTDFSWVSRSLGVIRGQSLIVTLPGSPKAVTQSLDAIKAPLKHIVNTLQKTTS